MLRRLVPGYSQSRCASLTTLGVLVHTFARRYPDGRPEPDYNDSLIDFDCVVLDCSITDGTGVPVLVETFGGKRQYYFYFTSSEAAHSTLAEIIDRFPEHDLAIETTEDPSWRFLQRYYADYFPDEIIPG